MMLKRDRTPDEKRIDKLTKGAIMRLGTQPSQEAETMNAFPHVLHWDKLGRKGQRCRVIRPGFRIVLVEFEDGFRHTVNRMAIRRDDTWRDPKQAQAPTTTPTTPPTKATTRFAGNKSTTPTTTTA